VVFSYNSIYEKLVVTVIIVLVIMELVAVINNFLYVLFEENTIQSPTHHRKDKLTIP